MGGTRLVVIGDSVPWGQGLLDIHKYANSVRDQLAARGRTLTLEMLAHSGATIGVRGPGDTSRIDGEVPVPSPTVLEQVETYTGDPGDVSLLLMDGGINDVSIKVILNPLTTLEELRFKTRKYCLQDMKTLLETVSSTFTGREAQILVTGYFPILSHESEPLRASLLLAVHGISFTSQLAFHDIVLDKIVSLCLQFWNDSTAFLQQAVLEHGDSRVAFVSAPFTEQNAVFASAPWLWGVNADLSAQDEVIAGRRAACNARYPLIDVVDREACYRASAGHPNGTGAQQFANAILAAV